MQSMLGETDPSTNIEVSRFHSMCHGEINGLFRMETSILSLFCLLLFMFWTLLSSFGTVVVELYVFGEVRRKKDIKERKCEGRKSEGGGESEG